MLGHQLRVDSQMNSLSSPSCVQVLTPYVAQRGLIENMSRRLATHLHWDVKTVDSFQVRAGGVSVTPPTTTTTPIEGQRWRCGPHNGPTGRPIVPGPMATPQSSTRVTRSMMKAMKAEVHSEEAISSEAS